MVNAGDFHGSYQLHECPRRLWSNTNKPELKALPSEFEQFLFRKGKVQRAASAACAMDAAREGCERSAYLTVGKSVESSGGLP